MSDGTPGRNYSAFDSELTHQALNARQLVSVEAAELILEKDLTGELLAQKIEHYASSPQILASMAANMRKQARPDAAKAIVKDLYDADEDRFGGML